MSTDRSSEYGAISNSVVCVRFAWLDLADLSAWEFPLARINVQMPVKVPFGMRERSWFRLILSFSCEIVLGLAVKRDFLKLDQAEVELTTNIFRTGKMTGRHAQIMPKFTSAIMPLSISGFCPEGRQVTYASA